MNRMWIAAVAMIAWALTASVASADPGGYAPPGGPSASPFPTFAQMGGPNTLLGAGDLPPGRGPDMYGLHPCLKRFFHIPPGGKHGRSGYGAAGPNWGAAGYGMGGPAYGIPPGYSSTPQMQGTLVFPHHTYVRSPRDYFMMDQKK